MTKLQRQKLRDKNRRAKVREKKRLRRLRLKERRQRRAQKRFEKNAPKRALKDWSLEVRSGGKCCVCGSKNHLQAHHVLPKERYPEYKLKRINGVPLCPTCHKYGKFSAHRNPLWFVLWLRRHRPEVYQWAKSHLGTKV